MTTLEGQMNGEVLTNYANWAIETDLWDGKLITKEKSPKFLQEQSNRISALLFKNYPDRCDFHQTAVQLAYLGIESDQAPSKACMPLDRILIQESLGKSLKKFWKKHKVAIIVGASTLLVITAVAVVTIYSGGTAGGAAAAAGGAALKNLDDNADNETSKTSPPNLPKITPQPFQSPTTTIIEIPSPSLTDSFPKNVFEVFSKTLLPPSTSYSGGVFNQTPSNYQAIAPFSGFNIPEPANFTSFLQKPPPTSSSYDWQQVVNPQKFVPNWSIEKPPSFSFPLSPISKVVQPEQIKSSHSLLGWCLQTMGYGIVDFDPSDGMKLPSYSEIQTSQRVVSSVNPLSRCRIGGSNGIATSPTDAMNNWNYLKAMFPDTSSEWTYSNSHGFLVDIAEAAFINLSGYSPNTAKLHQEAWMEFHEANKDHPNQKFLQYCHSQGAIHVKNALMGAPKEIRQRVIVVALAPATIIPDELCFKAHNYASKRDVVYKLEGIRNGIRDICFGILGFAVKMLWGSSSEERYSAGELVLLEPHPDATFIDHSFQSPTLVEIIEKHGNEYIDQKGVYQ